MGSELGTQLKEVGVFVPEPKSSKVLKAGEVGYLIGTIKDPLEIKIGDTVTHQKDGAKEALPGFAEVHPMVFCGLYPISTTT